MIKDVNEILDQIGGLNDLELLKLAGVILEIVDGRGNIKTNDLVINIVDLVNKEREE